MMKTKKTLLAAAVLSVVALTGCTSGDSDPSPTVTKAPKETPRPEVSEAPTEVPRGKNDGSKVPVEEFVEPVTKKAETLTKVYSSEEIYEAAENVCYQIINGALVEDVILNTKNKALKAAEGTDVNMKEFKSDVDTLINSGVKSYCPEFLPSGGEAEMNDAAGITPWGEVGNKGKSNKERPEVVTPEELKKLKQKEENGQ